MRFLSRLRLDSRRRAFSVAWFVLVGYAAWDLNYSFFDLRWTNAHLVREVGLIGYVLYDLAESVTSSFDGVEDVDVAPFRSFLAERDRRRATGAPHAERRLRNVVFLQLESIDYVAVGATHDGEPVMPFLSGLQDRTLFFENVLDQTGAGRSADAHVLVLTSQVPIQNRAIFTQFDLSSIRSLPRILNAEGYRTFSLEGHQGEFWRWKLNHQRLGVQETLSMNELDTSEQLGWGISDESLVEQALERMEGGGPFFAHILLLTNHHPFHWVRESTGATFQDIVSDYLISARYVDSVIEHLFDGLQKRGLLDDTIVAVFSDHDSGITQELSERLGADYRDGVEHERIPLAIWDGGRARTITRPVGLQDVAPTVLELLGLPIPASFVGVPASRGYSDVLLQNGTRISGLDEDGELIMSRVPIDMTLLTRLAIERPEALP